MHNSVRTACLEMRSFITSLFVLVLVNVVYCSESLNSGKYRFLSNASKLDLQRMEILYYVSNTPKLVCAADCMENADCVGYALCSETERTHTCFLLTSITMPEASSTPGYCKIYFKESKTSDVFGLNMVGNSLISPTHSSVLPSYRQSTFVYSTVWSSEFLSTICCKDSQVAENRASLATMPFTDAIPGSVTASHPINVEDSDLETITKPNHILMSSDSFENTKITSSSSLSTATWTSSKAISDKLLTSEGNTFFDDGATSAITGADAGSTYITSLLEARHSNSFDLYSSEITGSMAHAILSITKTQDNMQWINVQSTDTFYSLLSATEANWDSFEGQTILTKSLGDDSLNTISIISTDTETYPTDDVLIKYACVDKKCLYIQPVG